MPDSGLLLISSAQPDQSVLLTKLETGQVPFGAQMPYLQSPLSAAQIACVHAWILTQLGTDGGDAVDDASLDGGTQ